MDYRLKAIFIDSLNLPPSSFQLLDLNHPILPKPQRITYQDQFFCLPDQIHCLFYNITNDTINFHLTELINYKMQFTLQIEAITLIDPKFEINKLHIIEFLDSLTEKIREQAYWLEINPMGIFLFALTDIGLFYGLSTISQLICQNQHLWVVQSVVIHDFPQFYFRGTTIQVCHGQVPTVETIKKTIRFLARYKNNLLGLNLEDIMSFDKWPHIGKWRGSYTSQEITEMQEYARLYFIELFPGFQALGHLENFLYYPEFRDLAEFPGANCLDLSNPKSKEILEAWYREIVQKFNPRYVHIELDEAYDFGLYKSKELVTQKGRNQVLLDHLLFLHKLLHQELGRDIFMYHDTVMNWAQDILPQLPKDIKIIFWNYLNLPKYPTIKKLVNLGFDVFVSPAIANWARPFPKVAHSYQNIKKMAIAGVKARAKGFMNSSWGDFNNENLFENNYYGLAIGSDFAWNPMGHNYDRFQRAFVSDFFGMPNYHLLWDTILWIAQLNHGGVFNTPFFNHLWEHPFGLKTPSYSCSQAKMDLKTIKMAEEMLKTAIITITRNKQVVENLDYVLKIQRFNAQKAILSNKLFKKGKKTRKIEPKFIPKIKDQLNFLQTVWEQYKTLWLQCAKPEGLERIERNYIKLKETFSEIINSCEQNQAYLNPFLISEWIIHPNGQNKQTPHYFKTEFSLNLEQLKSIKSAKIQGIANTYMKIRINSQEVGDIISRFYLSPVIFDNAVKIFDIHPVLLVGKNVIEIEGWEFTDSLLTVNIYAEVNFQNGNTIYIKTNDQWLVKSDTAPIPTQWYPAKSLGAPPNINGEIRIPDLQHNQPSWISRKFGERGYRESIIFMATKSHRLARLASKFLS